MVYVVRLPYPMLKTKGWPQGAIEAAVAPVNSKAMGWLRERRPVAFHVMLLKGLLSSVQAER